MQLSVWQAGRMRPLFFSCSCQPVWAYHGALCDSLHTFVCFNYTSAVRCSMKQVDACDKPLCLMPLWSGCFTSIRCSRAVLFFFVAANPYQQPPHDPTQSKQWCKWGCACLSWVTPSVCLCLCMCWLFPLLVLLSHAQHWLFSSYCGSRGSSSATGTVWHMNVKWKKQPTRKRAEQDPHGVDCGCSFVLVFPETKSNFEFLEYFLSLFRAMKRRQHSSSYDISSVFVLF